MTPESSLAPSLASPDVTPWHIKTPFLSNAVVCLISLPPYPGIALQVGLMLKGLYIDNVVFGGPAYNSQVSDSMVLCFII